MLSHTLTGCLDGHRREENAALAAAVVVAEAAEDSGSLSTARAAGSRGDGRVLVLPGAPWDPGAAGCNQLIRDGATLVRSLTDILEELGASSPAPAAPGSPADAGPAEAWPGLTAAARAVLTALVDGQVLGPSRLAAATNLPPAELDTALLDLELAGLIRRTAAGAQAIALPPSRPPGRVPPAPAPRGPPTASGFAEVLERPPPGRDDGGDDQPPWPTGPAPGRPGRR